MLFVVCAVVLLLYAARIVLTEVLGSRGVHPRSLSDFQESLDEAGWRELRENPLSMGRSAVREKSALLDNMVGVVNYRTYADGEDLAPDLSEQAEARISEYAAIVDQLDEEIADSVAREQERGSAAGGGTAEERRREPMRYVHIVCVASLVVLFIGSLFVG